ncbi:unnamed protein product [Ambrosiozyma monospora]|uniref:Unnamed protein product n=1 Tax=Ambrosiozyma monospora TaxID=43982 RepID=A0A9W6YZ66_AMBMO|nr:unnamed protein product [Ambrosiozyma monospora]
MEAPSHRQVTTYKQVYIIAITVTDSIEMSFNPYSFADGAASANPFIPNPQLQQKGKTTSPNQDVQGLPPFCYPSEVPYGYDYMMQMNPYAGRLPMMAPNGQPLYPPQMMMMKPPVPVPSMTPPVLSGNNVVSPPPGFETLQPSTPAETYPHDSLKSKTSFFSQITHATQATDATTGRAIGSSKGSHRVVTKSSDTAKRPISAKSDENLDLLDISDDSEDDNNEGQSATPVEFHGKETIDMFRKLKETPVLLLKSSADSMPKSQNSSRFSSSYKPVTSKQKSTSPKQIKTSPAIDMKSTFKDAVLRSLASKNTLNNQATPLSDNTLNGLVAVAKAAAAATEDTPQLSNEALASFMSKLKNKGISLQNNDSKSNSASPKTEPVKLVKSTSKQPTESTREAKAKFLAGLKNIPVKPLPENTKPKSHKELIEASKMNSRAKINSHQKPKSVQNEDEESINDTVGSMRGSEIPLQDLYNSVESSVEGEVNGYHQDHSNNGNDEYQDHDKADEGYYQGDENYDGDVEGEVEDGEEEEEYDDDVPNDRGRAVTPIPLDVEDYDVRRFQYDDDSRSPSPLPPPIIDSSFRPISQGSEIDQDHTLESSKATESKKVSKVKGKAEKVKNKAEKYASKNIENIKKLEKELEDAEPLKPVPVSYDPPSTPETAKSSQRGSTFETSPIKNNYNPNPSTSDNDEIKGAGKVIYFGWDDRNYGEKPHDSYSEFKDTTSPVAPKGPTINPERFKLMTRKDDEFDGENQNDSYKNGYAYARANRKHSGKEKFVPLEFDPDDEFPGPTPEEQAYLHTDPDSEFSSKKEKKRRHKERMRQLRNENVKLQIVDDISSSAYTPPSSAGKKKPEKVKPIMVGKLSVQSKESNGQNRKPVEGYLPTSIPVNYKKRQQPVKKQEPPEEKPPLDPSKVQPMPSFDDEGYDYDW